MDCHGLSGIEQDGVQQRQTGNGMAAPAVLIGCWRLTFATSMSRPRTVIVQVLVIREKANVHSAVGRIMVCRRPIVTLTTNFIAIALVGLPEVAIARRTMAHHSCPSGFA